MRHLGRYCFGNFTNVASLRKRKEDDDIPVSESSSTATWTSARTSASASPAICSILFPIQCIFCNKYEKKKNDGSKECLTKCVTECAESLIKETAALKNDYQMIGKIDGIDLRAKEALYHESMQEELY